MHMKDTCWRTLFHLERDVVVTYISTTMNHGRPLLTVPVCDIISRRAHVLLMILSVLNVARHSTTGGRIATPIVALTSMVISLRLIKFR